jgi:hypothetical protein
LANIFYTQICSVYPTNTLLLGILFEIIYPLKTDEETVKELFFFYVKGKLFLNVKQNETIMIAFSDLFPPNPLPLQRKCKQV